mgnify:CR=1 FL=1
MAIGKKWEGGDGEYQGQETQIGSPETGEKEYQESQGQSEM